MNFSKFSKNALLAAGLVAAMSSCNKDMKDEISTTKSNVESNQAVLAEQNAASEAEIAKQDSLRALDIANAETEAAEQAAEEAAIVAANEGYYYSQSGTASIIAEGYNQSNGEKYSKKNLSLGYTTKSENTFTKTEMSGSYYDYYDSDKGEYVYVDYSYTQEKWVVTFYSNTGSTIEDNALRSWFTVTITRNIDLVSEASERTLENEGIYLYIDEERVDGGYYNLTQDDGFNVWKATDNFSEFYFDISSFEYNETSHAIKFDLESTENSGSNTNIELDIAVDSEILQEITNSYRVK
jgi:hypothetical protein